MPTRMPEDDIDFLSSSSDSDIPPAPPAVVEQSPTLVETANMDEAKSATESVAAPSSVETGEKNVPAAQPAARSGSVGHGGQKVTGDLNMLSEDELKA
jgi:hypothetical protein